MVTWSNIGPPIAPSARDGYALAYDEANHVTLLFGGLSEQFGQLSDFWSWNGTTWNQFVFSASTNAVSPPALASPVMAFDASHQQTVLFGNHNGVAETWIWDGTTWTKKSTSIAPRPRQQTAMVYDAAHSHVMLVGGFDAIHSQELGDSWIWDGTSWSEVHPATTPGALHGAALAFDAARQTVVLFGGASGTQSLSSTWLWNGSDWTLSSPVTSPTVAVGPTSMAYDPARQRTVLFSTDGTTWEWDGASWAQDSPLLSPVPRSIGALTYDATNRNVVLFGGTDETTSALLADTWTFSFAGPPTVTVVDPPDVVVSDPTPQFSFTTTGNPTETECSEDEGSYQSCSSPYSSATLIDGNHSLSIRVTNLLGSTTTSWTFRTTSLDWTHLAPTLSPSARNGESLAYDDACDCVIMFGGVAFPTDLSNPRTVYLSDTWEWDGTTWTQLFPVHSPGQGDSVYQMIFDQAQHVMILFGGALEGETWAWDGSDWTQLFPSTVPPNGGSSLAYDSARGRIVKFGGYSSTSGPNNDTWEWDGVDWIEVTPPSTPSARYGSAMAYDANQGQTILFSGAGVGVGADTWAWDGEHWRQLSPAHSPPKGTTYSMAYDESTARVVMTGGYDAALNGAYVWQWDGADWSEYVSATPAPGYTDPFTTCYDKQRSEVMVFGGIDGSSNAPIGDTWTYGF